MRVYNYSDLRKNLATVLNQAKYDGVVRVTRKNGDVFLIQPETPKKSPLDVKGVNLNLSADDIVSFVRESRSERVDS